MDEFGFLRLTPRVIDRAEQVLKLAETLAQADWVGMDTEADSLHGYPERLCLMQLSFADGDVLVDTLAEADFRPVFEVLGRKRIILHGSDYDLRLLYRTYGFRVVDFFDTMWAARLAGLRRFGLADLTEQILGVQLSKASRKANWARRPLTEQMTEYARNDTRYLRPLERQLWGRLKELGRLDWLEECCERVAAVACEDVVEDPDLVWRVKGSDRLDPKALAVLRELWQWREKIALRQRRPPFFILGHEPLVQIACAAAADSPWNQFLPRRWEPSRSREIGKAVANALALPSDRLPGKRKQRARVSFSPEQHARVDEIERTRDARAAELDIDPTLIASRAMLNALAADGNAGMKQLMAWQRKLLS